MQISDVEVLEVGIQGGIDSVLNNLLFTNNKNGMQKIVLTCTLGKLLNHTTIVRGTA